MTYFFTFVKPQLRLIHHERRYIYARVSQVKGKRKSLTKKKKERERVHIERLASSEHDQMDFSLDKHPNIH